MPQPTHDRWWQIDATFSEALALSQEERAAFLEAACDGDVALRREVEHLLAAHEASEAYLEDPADWIDVPLLPGLHAEPSAPATQGQHVGPYRLLREIGRGGMGAVYLAERADGQFHQRVALKLIRGGFVTEEALRRFRLERAILARLEHPNIARLLDGGVTEAGRPYFVMEYVAGEPITAYCDGHKLGVAARLELFRTVCGAVHYAHQNLVVHRDLTPSNILVIPASAGTGSDGQVKLLDFGIAKLLDAASSGVTVPVTGQGMRLMTPEYASPEQVRGGMITTASDVYQLGVLLYELLTGRRPYRLPSRVLHEVARVICGEDPEKPSTAVTGSGTSAASDDPAHPITPEAVSRARGTSVERLRRRLSGDLDNIVLMAMRKEPGRRYASAEQLGEDIARHLGRLPVRARPDTVLYRTSRFVRRHRLGVGAVLLIAFLVVGFAVSTAIQATRIAHERDRAEEATAFLADLFEAFEPVEAQGATVTARDMLDRGVERIRSELPDQPLMQARMMTVIGQVYQLQGHYAEAEALLEEALAIRLRLLGPGHLDTADSQRSLAELRQTRGAPDAEPLYRAALATYRKRLGDTDPLVAFTLIGLALELRDRGDYDGAEALFREILTTFREPLGAHVDIATALMFLGKLQTRKGAYADAESLLREALAMRRRLMGDMHPAVANSLDALGELDLARGAYEAAEQLFQDALAMRRIIYEEGHTDLAASLLYLAQVRRAEGAYADAEGLLRDALASYSLAFGDAGPDVATVLQHLAATRMAQGDLNAADSLFQGALTIWQNTARGTAQARPPTLLIDMGTLRLAQGSGARAEPLLREGLALLQETLPDPHGRIAEAQGLLGACLGRLQRYDEAEPLLLESYQGFQDQFGDRHGEVANALDRLIALYEAWGKAEDAERYRALRAARTTSR